MTEDEMVEWHHGLNGHEFEQTLGVGDGQGSLTLEEGMTTHSSVLAWRISSLCNPMDYSTPGFPNHHQLPKLAQTHVH